MEITLKSLVVVAKDMVSCDLQGETAILNLNDGVYYGLDEVGTSIWNLIQTPITVEKILNELLKIYDVEKEKCQSDLYELMNDMAEKGILEVK